MAEDGIVDGTSNTITIEEEDPAVGHIPGRRPDGPNENTPDDSPAEDGSPFPTPDDPAPRGLERAETINSDEGSEEAFEPSDGSAVADVVPEGEAPLAFGTGAAGDDYYAASTAESGELSIPGDDPAVDVPEVQTGGYEPALDELPDEANDVSASDGNDPGLLEQVAEAVGDFWDDATDLVT